MVGFIDYWKERTGHPDQWFCHCIGIRQEKLISWRKRFSLPNRHNGQIPRDFWLDDGERQAIIDFYSEHRDDGYRRCAYMMIDQDIAYASPSTVYRVLKKAGVMRSKRGKASCKGQGFEQPLEPHEHWHIDISYVRIRERFYFLICVLDGCSRFIVHWDLRPDMNEEDVAIVVQAAKEKVPEARARVISDNGKQFVGKEFKTLIAYHGLTHVRTSPYYPQSNGKLERFHGSVKGECISKKALCDHDHAREVIAAYIHHYNHCRLHSAIGYITPFDRLNGRQDAIHENRDRKLAEARKRRKTKHSQPLKRKVA